MKWIRILYASVLANLLWASSALADTAVSFDSIENAAKRSTDLSRQLLVMIFGDVVTNPLSTNATMVGQLFFIFNGIVFALAIVWFLLISLKHITKAGHTGKVFGSGATPMAVAPFRMQKRLFNRPPGPMRTRSMQSPTHRGTAMSWPPQ